jgi:nucleoside-diphosphate-sugar epimerase
MNYLITGVAGFVGSSLARAIISMSPDAVITGIDNMSFGYRERLSDIIGKIEFVEGDVVDLVQLMGLRHFDVIVHCAAIAPLPECQRDSYRALVQNVAVCGAVADYALLTGSRNIVFFSSGAVYEGAIDFPTPEDTHITTSLVYPTSKFIAEQYFASMCRSHNLNVTAIRLFNLYGPHQDYFRKQPPLIGYLLTCLIRNLPATLYSSGEQRRDYIYIDDLLNLVQLCALKMNEFSEGGHFTAINAGSGRPVSVNSIIRTLERISGRSLSVQRLPASQYWDKYDELFLRKIPIERCVIEREVNKFTQAAVVKAQREFGWTAGIKLEDGLASCFEYAQSIISD